MANGTIAASQLEMLSQSGTGTTTIIPAATNINRTLTLPDASGTLATTDTAGFPSGTAMMFVQTAAPTGWTKSTTHNNKALRVVSGTAGSGGSVDFTTAFGTPAVSGSLSGTVGATTLTEAQMPSHTHVQRGTAASGTTNHVVSGSRAASAANTSTISAATGGSGSHDHSFSGSLSSATATINVAYVDVIIASKD